MPITATTTDVFVSRIWTFDLAMLDEYHSSWIAAITALRAATPIAAGRSMRRGWNSDKTLFSQALFKPLNKAARTCFDYCLKELKAGDFHYDLEAWANVGDPQAYNVQHGHPRTLLSGVYYLEVPTNSGTIQFHEPRPACRYSLIAPGAPFGSNTAGLTPKSGRLLVFPAWLEHSVTENLSNATRISIPINAILSNPTSTPMQAERPAAPPKSGSTLIGKIR